MQVKVEGNLATFFPHGFIRVSRALDIYAILMSYCPAYNSTINRIFLAIYVIGERELFNAS